MMVKLNTWHFVTLWAYFLLSKMYVILNANQIFRKTILLCKQLVYKS